jgi:hypothetical protein
MIDNAVSPENKAKTIEMIKEVVSSIISTLKPNTNYTVKQIFGDYWKSYDIQYQRYVGGQFRQLVEQQALPLEYVGKNSARSREYTTL